MKSLQLPKNKYLRLLINVGFILFWWFFSTAVINRYLVSGIIKYFDPNAFQDSISSYILALLWSTTFVPILFFTWFLFLKNKFDRLGINIFLLEFWFFLAAISYQQITFNLIDKNLNLYLNITKHTIGNFDVAFLLFFIIPSLLVSVFIWFDKLRPRPRITRSKD